MKNAVFWDVAPCRSCVNRRFWGTSVHSSVCSHLLTLVSRSRIFLPRRWGRYVPPKRRFTQDLHGATSQKTAFFNGILNFHNRYISAWRFCAVYVQHRSLFFLRIPLLDTTCFGLTGHLQVCRYISNDVNHIVQFSRNINSSSQRLGWVLLWIFVGQ
jgi:hypothetical protein